MQEAGPEYPGAYTIDYATDAEDRVRLTVRATTRSPLDPRPPKGSPQDVDEPISCSAHTWQAGTTCSLTDTLSPRPASRVTGLSTGCALPLPVEGLCVRRLRHRSGLSSPLSLLPFIASLIAAEPRQEALLVLLGPVQRLAHRQRLGDGHGHCRLGQRRPRTLPLQGQPTPLGVCQRRVERERAA